MPGSGIPLAAAALAAAAVVPATAPAGQAAAPPARPASPTAVAAGPLSGVVVGIDPGHNGRNYADPAYINHPVWNGREEEACDTTGTETDSGYTEPRFTFRVATYLARDLRRDGATVVMTRHNNHGVGPCVNRRARIIDKANAAVAIDIHGDGGPPGGRGFAILEPVRDHVNRHVIRSSAVFGNDVRRSLLSTTRMPESTYDGRHGIAKRDDLAGLNLATQPKVLVECGNMRNARDARMMVSSSFQQRLAIAFTRAIIDFLQRPR
jgi:N-acetylmuramoyl-L-alanine amidase